MNKRRIWIASLCCLLTLFNSNASIAKSGYVGDVLEFSKPTIPYGAIDKGCQFSSGDSELLVYSWGSVEILRYFTGTRIVKCDYYYMAEIGKTSLGQAIYNSYHETIEYDITCEPIKLNNIPSVLSLSVGQEYRINWTYYPSSKKKPEVEYSSSNSSVATVSYNGNICAVGDGEAVITVNNGSGPDAQISVKVTGTPKLSVTANRNDGLISSGTIIFLTPMSNGNSISGCDIYYTVDGFTPNTSSQKYTSSGVSITNSCTLKAIAYKDGYESEVGSWIYKIKVDRITIDYPSLSLRIDEEKQISASVFPYNAANKNVTWSSSNTTVATVSSNGFVTAKSYGTATITCKANDGSGVTAKCTVDVHGPLVAEINATNFPDANFRNFLLSQTYGSDGKLTEDEIKSIISIDVEKKEIANLKGIEFFTELTNLNCNTNQLTSLDVSKNTALKYLQCFSNQLTSLDVSKNTALTLLYCQTNQLTTLDVSKNTALTSLQCFSNQLTSLDVSKNTALTSLYCYSNQLSSLDVSKNTALTSLYCYSNQLSSLDVSKNTALTSLYCYSNQLSSLDVSKNTALTELNCQKNQLTSLDVSKNTTLTFLSCSDNQISQLDVSKNTALTELNCQKNQLTSLDVSRNTALTDLCCSYNQITQLDVSKNTALTYLNCEQNQLTSLDVSKNTALTNLRCTNNQLTQLDVSMNTALTSLYCFVNQLTSLDVSKNTALTTLSCGNNQLTSLDVSKNTALTTLSCYYNGIKGEAMDKLISSLPQNKTSDIHRFIVVEEDLAKEGNVCTVSQVEAAKAKGWTPCYYDSTTKEYVDFEGSSAVVLIDNIILSSNTLTLDEGKTQLLTATVTPSNATDKSVTWSSSNTSVATVSSSGLVTAKSAGTATITCKANDGSGKEATCKVTVQSVPTTPEIYITSIKSGNTNLMSLTKEDNLSLTATFKNYGATTTAYARLWIFDQNMETVAYSDYQSYPFNADSETTVSMDYALTDIPAGKYFASILYYDEWERNTWLYSSEYLVDIEIVDPSPINKGDVNEDGKVNGTDLVALTNIILGKNAQKASADVNGDGKVNGTDYVALANIILGKTAASRSLNDGMAVGCTATLQVEPLTIWAGETRELTVSLTNPDDELTLLQFDLLLPDGLYINKVGDDPCVSMGSRTSEHSHQLSTYADGQRVRCLLASPANELISGTEGAVVRLTVTAADDFSGGSLLLANAIGVSPCEQEVIMPSQRYGLTDSATGVADVKNAEESSEVFSLTGQRQVKMKRGINIVNGKKIIKK